MAISEAQLERWSHQGAIATSRDTYATIKRALEDSKARYANRAINIFLQGSYGNDTNIYFESDVDIVICCSDTCYYDESGLPADQKAVHQSTLKPATYQYREFKAAVFDTLTSAFGNSVSMGNNSIKIAASGSRRSSDVIATFNFHRYYRYVSANDHSFYKGITFFRNDNTKINNFPKYHLDNLTSKHQATASRLKPMIRIFKNIRSQLVDKKLIGKGDAPSYFVEGLLYNVPNDIFKHTNADTVFGILQWLHTTTDRSNFVCANERYYLLRDNDPVCWPKANGENFIRETIKFWNEWK